jgi:methylated-DNA-protein-cysteine methyltransferase-like protein
MAKYLFKSSQIKTLRLFDRVYLVVKKIPKGKVATYGQIAEILGTKDSRKVGFALHANKDQDVPCHRVVNKEGRLAPNFAFDGWREQRRRLVSEGVNFKDETHVDLSKCI